MLLIILIILIVLAFGGGLFGGGGALGWSPLGLLLMVLLVLWLAGAVR